MGASRYETPSLRGRRYLFGSSTREKAGHDTLNTPGPGAYEHSRTNQAPKYTIPRKSSQT